MLKEKLKKALKKAGLSEGLVDVINITSEDQIEGIVNQLKSTQDNELELDYSLIIKSEGFKQYVEKQGGFKKIVEESPVLKSGHDKAITEAVNTNKKKLLKELAQDGDGEESGQQQNDGDTPAWAKALIEKVNGFEKKTQESSKLEQAKSVLNASKIIPQSFKEKWQKRIALESDTSFEDQVKELEAEYSEIHKSIIGDNAGSGLPQGGSSDKKVSDEEVGDLVKDLGI